MLNSIKYLATGISAFMIVWFLVSYGNVLLHNDPAYGDFKYAPWNMIVLLFRR